MANKIETPTKGVLLYAWGSKVRSDQVCHVEQETVFWLNEP